MIYLIQYDRRAGRLVEIKEFDFEDKQDAEEERLCVELQLLDKHLPREVVLLEAKSEQELRKTHRRYFEGLDQMLTSSTAQ